MTPSADTEAERTGGTRPDAAGSYPDFFIVGHPKSGTTALYEALRRHPQIFMPELKEPGYFAAEIPRRGHRIELPATAEEYLRLFAPARPGQRVGEASAMYLWSPTAPKRIAAAEPAARIIAILREPAAFLRSLHLQNLQSQYETEPDLLAALALEPARREGREIPPECQRPQALLYSEYVRYAEQLQRYRAAFAAEQMLTLIYDDFRADNEGSVRAVLRMLDVDPTVQLAMREANPTVAVRSHAIEDLLHGVTLGRGPLLGAVKRGIVAVAPRRVRQRMLRTARRRLTVAEPPAEDAAAMAELRRRFAPEVEALSAYLGRDLVALWGYDALA
jgi:hypothetical protein